MSTAHARLPPVSTCLPPDFARLTSVSPRLTPVSVCLPLVPARLTPVSARLTPVSARLTPVSARLTPVSARLTPVPPWLSRRLVILAGEVEAFEKVVFEERRWVSHLLGVWG